MGQNEMLIRQRDPEHGARQHRHDRSFNTDRFVRIHDVDLSKIANSAALTEAPAAQSIPDLPAIASCKRTLRAVRTRTIFSRTSFVNVQRAAVQFMAVERIFRRTGLLVVIHCDKGEAARFTGHLVHHQMDFVDGAVFFEQILKIVLGGLKREITYVQFHCVLNLGKN